MEGFSIVMLVFSLLVPICVGVLTIGILGFVGWIIYRQFKKRDDQRASAQAWPSTSGVVLESKIVMQHRAGGGSTEAAYVLYQYEVGGQMLHGNVVAAGDQYMNVRTAANIRERLARYPSGAQVTVYYNPANPSDAALER